MFRCIFRYQGIFFKKEEIIELADYKNKFYDETLECNEKNSGKNGGILCLKHLGAFKIVAYIYVMML